MHGLYDTDRKAKAARVKRIVSSVLFVVVTVSILAVSFWAYFNVYNPQKQFFIRNSNYAFLEIQKYVSEVYEKQGYIYETENQTVDKVCEHFLFENLVQGGSCNLSNSFNPVRNFTFKGKKIDVFGFEKPPTIADKTIYKDILVDADGEANGENMVGVDRIPIRIYSNGRMGGLVTPVNCNKKDTDEFGFDRSLLCAGGEDIDYMATNIPFSFNVYQIGGDNGKTRVLNRNISFLRADCMAFGGEMVALDDYCEMKGFPWLAACYNDFPCAVDYSKIKRNEKKENNK